MRKIRNFISFFLVVFSLSATSSAIAAGVVNLDSKAHTILANGKEIVIEAGATWRNPGKVKIIYKDREFNMQDYDEYAIWNDNDFGPQRRYIGGGNVSAR